MVALNGRVRFSHLGSTSGGNILGKMAKNCMKITKSTFLGQNSGWGGGHGGQANLCFWAWKNREKLLKVSL